MVLEARRAANMDSAANNEAACAVAELANPLIRRKRFAEDMQRFPVRLPDRWAGTVKTSRLVLHEA